MRLMVYSHDTFGLGNIRRMLAICQHLLACLPDLSILLVSGSPMLHSFRLPSGLDYIKLPCLNRGDRGELSAKYLGTKTDEVIQLRSELILSAAANFKPDLFLVDKKPCGLQSELSKTLNYLKIELPKTKLVLLLRDILDRPDKTIAEWRSHHYYQLIDTLYDSVLVVGSPEVFDLCQDYQLPDSVAQKVTYCGYIRKHPDPEQSWKLRQRLGMSDGDRLVLVTPGGGEDGFNLVDTYLSGLLLLPASHALKSLIICGPEMPSQQREQLYQTAARFPHVTMGEFTDGMVSYMDAADVVLSMAGYNTITEILSVKSRAVVVPRVSPSQEQQIRAERMARLGLFQTLHPDQLSPYLLMKSVLHQLYIDAHQPTGSLDLEALPRITQHILALLHQTPTSLSIPVYARSSSRLWPETTTVAPQ